MSRQRSNCFVIRKELLSNEIPKLYDIKNEDDDSFEIQDNDNSLNDQKNKYKFVCETNLGDLKKPEFKNIKKEYPSKLNTNLYLHEKAHVIDNFEKSNVAQIEGHTQIIDFDKFLHQFKCEDEIRNLELTDLLDIDYEQLDETKNKAIEFIDATSSLIFEKEQTGEDTQTESDLVLFFSQKLQEMKNNEINLQIFANNLKKVRGVSYSNNGVKVYFNIYRKK